MSRFLPAVAVAIALLGVATRAAAQQPPPANKTSSTIIKTPGGKIVKSTETVEKYAIMWATRRLDPATKDSKGRPIEPLQKLFDQSDLPEDQRAPRPAMILLTKQNPDHDAEEAMFGSDAVCLASRYFDCVKIFIEDLDAKELKDRYAKQVPTIIFLDSATKETGRMPGGGGPDGVWTQMAKAANIHFKKPLTDVVAKYEDFLRRFDKVSEQQIALSTRITKNETEDEKRPSDRLKAEIKSAQAELVAVKKERKKLDKEEEGLLKLEFKTDPYAPPPPPKKP